MQKWPCRVNPPNPTANSAKKNRQGASVNIALFLGELDRLGVVVSATDDGFLDLEPAEVLTDELLERVRELKPDILKHLAKPEPELLESSKTLERLPFELEALVRAATADSLPKSATLETGIIPDLNRWVLAWGCAYLLRSPDAREHLELAYREWQTHLERILN